MPREPPSYADVTRKARSALDALDGRPAAPEYDDEREVLAAAVVRGGDPDGGPGPTLGDRLDRFDADGLDPTDGLGAGYLPLDGQRHVNLGVVNAEGLRLLHDRGARLFVRSETASYSLVVAVLPLDPPATDENE